MNVIATLSDDRMNMYRHVCTGEKLGWVIFVSDFTFIRVHRVYCHPEDGPVLLIGSDVYEVDPDDCDLYPTENAAKDAYYAMPPEHWI